jgi:hypothetical protein
MRVTCPSAYMIYPRGFGGGFGSPFGGRMGMGGLGQDDDSGVDVSAGLTYTDTTGAVDLSTLNSIPLTTAANDTLTTAALTNIATTPDLSSYITGSGAPTTSSGTAQILTAAGIAAAAAAKGITAASGPYQVPGTSLIYNPATGQIINAAGSLVGTAALPALETGIASFMPLIIGAVVLLVLMESMGGRK